MAKALWEAHRLDLTLSNLKNDFIYKKDQRNKHLAFANFYYTKLMAHDFSHANFFGADLSKAFLATRVDDFVDMYEDRELVNLQNADLREAFVGDTRYIVERLNFLLVPNSDTRFYLGGAVEMHSIHELASSFLSGAQLEGVRGIIPSYMTQSPRTTTNR